MHVLHNSSAPRCSVRRTLELSTSIAPSINRTPTYHNHKHESELLQPPCVRTVTSRAYTDRREQLSNGPSVDYSSNPASPLEAWQSGRLGIGFSAGGLLYPYFLGVACALQELGILLPDTPVAGASAGSLIAACCKSGLSEEELMQACMDLARECRKRGTRTNLGPILQSVLRDTLPEDIHERCSGSVHIAVTQVLPTWRPELVSQFESREDLIQALLTSCHIPWYFNGQIARTYKRGIYFDGGLSNFIPAPPETDHVVRVCCFPSKQMRVFRGIQMSPDTFEPDWPHDMQQMLAWAFEPASNDMLHSLLNKGKSDAQAWSARHGMSGLSIDSSQDLGDIMFMDSSANSNDTRS